MATDPQAAKPPAVTISDADLIYRWLSRPKPLEPRERSGWGRWALLKDEFGIDSDSAIQICERQGFDPGELLRAPGGPLG